VATKLERANRSADRLSDLVDSLLDVSRLATGRFALVKEEFDLADLIRQVIEGFRAAAARVRCEMLAKIEGPVLGSWDRVRIEQLATNVIANAIKYGAGGPVELALSQLDGEALFEVRDHGPGIAAHDVDRVFERFERAAAMRHYGGLGV